MGQKTEFEKKLHRCMGEVANVLDHHVITKDIDEQSVYESWKFISNALTEKEEWHRKNASHAQDEVITKLEFDLRQLKNEREKLATKNVSLNYAKMDNYMRGIVNELHHLHRTLCDSPRDVREGQIRMFHDVIDEFYTFKKYIIGQKYPSEKTNQTSDRRADDE